MRPRALPTELLIGALAGLTATAAMTLAADALFRRLPSGERYPLPPRELTERAAETAGLHGRVSEAGMQTATLASHFAFGAAAGAGYAPFFLGRQRLPAELGGIGYALAVWGVSYLGWVPALGWLRPATEHPARRNALMLAVHVVWGAALGFTADRLSRALAPVRGGPTGDR